jgi:hypothetical protein
MGLTRIYGLVYSVYTATREAEMGKAVGIWTIEVGMVTADHGAVLDVERTAVDQVRVTFADGYVRRIGLGGYIFI